MLNAFFFGSEYRAAIGMKNWGITELIPNTKEDIFTTARLFAMATDISAIEQQK